MNYKSKHEKFIRFLAGMSKETFIEGLSSLEYNLQMPVNEELRSFVPLEPNFQIPNVFLKIQRNNKVEKMFAANNCTVNWDAQIDAAIEYLDDIQFDSGEMADAQPVHNDEILEILIKARFGNLAP